MSKIGRPTSFTPEKADAICGRLAEGESLRAICRDGDMPDAATVFRWLREFPEFCKQYTRAREEQADTLADEIVMIADEDTATTKSMGEDAVAVVFDSTAVARNRLRVEARKWVASKLKPKKYGDKLELAGDPEAPLVTKLERVIVKAKP